MKTILKPEKWVIELYPEATNAEYKLSNFVVVEKYDKDIIILHTITWGIYVLSETEYDNILQNDYLKGCKMVINSDIDEQSIAEKTYEKRMVKPFLPDYKAINTFVIFTTTACNARCYYCYEKGVLKTETMTENTAEDVVKFILSHNEDKRPILIQWFGGEPLLNTKIIDYISERLREENVPYNSTMITNAYLFNDENISKAKNLWNLTNCQITIDGIFDQYNNIKNYVYSDVDAFMVLINNMKNLMDNSDATITTRFNIGNDNIFEMYETISYIQEEFKAYKERGKIGYYAKCLYKINSGEEDKINKFDEELNRISSIIHIDNGDKCDVFSHYNKLYLRQPIFDCCMAYNANAVAILPNGAISPCEHVSNENIFGDVISGVTNINVVKEWQTIDYTKLSFCKENNCPLQPLCPRFYLCPSIILCNEANNKLNNRIKMAKERLIRTYEYYLEQYQKIKAGK